MSNDKKYTIGRLRGSFCIVFKDATGTRRRYTLGTNDASEAEFRANAFFTELTRPTGKNVAEIWNAYCEDREGRAIIVTMQYTWRALSQRFGHLAPDEITIEHSKAHIAERRMPTEKYPNGISDGTIHTELAHLRMVLLWAEKQGIIDRAPYIERPSKPAPSEKYLTRSEAKKLIQAAHLPHLKLFTTIALGTGARVSAILELTWDRCDFDRRLIDFRNPDLTRPHKGRSIAPMNDMVRNALLEAQPVALTPFVIEWAGRNVQSIKKGLAAVAKRAYLGKVTPHMLRHSAAVHMAEAGVNMEEISQYLGHSNPKITRDVYARYSPDYLQGAASALNYD